MHGEAFNFSYESPKTVLEVVQTLISQMDASSLQPVILNSVQNEIPHQYLSAKKAHDQLKWKPIYNFDEGLQQSIPWYAELLNSG